MLARDGSHLIGVHWHICKYRCFWFGEAEKMPVRDFVYLNGFQCSLAYVQVRGWLIKVRSIDTSERRLGSQWLSLAYKQLSAALFS
jgi:hypothetical protein